MKTFLSELKPAAALVASALLGAFLVIGTMTMLGAAASPAPSVSAPRAIEGLGRFNTTDIRALP